MDVWMLDGTFPLASEPVIFQFLAFLSAAESQTCGVQSEGLLRLK